MSPKIHFDKNLIIEKAYEIALEEGLKAITARKIASKLKSSVAPIYSNFLTLDELIQSVVLKVFQLNDELVNKQQGDSFLEKLGHASLYFAKTYPILFKELVMEPNPYMTSYDILEASIIRSLKTEDAFKEISDKDLKMMLLKLRAFQIGLSVMISNGQKPSWITDQELSQLLMSFGSDIMNK